MSRQITLSLALLVLVLPNLLAGCRGEAENGKPAIAQLPTVSVTVGTAVEKTATRQVELMGSLQSAEQADIAARISGSIVALPVVLGSRVAKGDLLAEIDAGEIGARQRQAKAQLEQARRNLDRERNLLKKNAATPENVRALEDALRIATAAWEEAGTMLAYTRILAPFAGVVTGKTASVGDLATPGKPLLQIENEARLQVITHIPESMIVGIAPGDRIQVSVPTAAIAVSGTVAEVAPTADRLSRTAQVKIDVPADPKLRSGQFARVTLASGSAVTVVVPETALTAYGQMERVFVVADGRARLRLVRSGARSAGKVEILSGLAAGESVVTGDSRRLVDGQPVSVN